MGLYYLTLESATTVMDILTCFLLHFTHPKLDYNGVNYNTYVDINLSILGSLCYNVIVLEWIALFQIESHLFLLYSEK